MTKTTILASAALWYVHSDKNTERGIEKHFHTFNHLLHKTNIAGTKNSIFEKKKQKTKNKKPYQNEAHCVHHSAIIISVTTPSEKTNTHTLGAHAYTHTHTTYFLWQNAGYPQGPSVKHECCTLLRPVTHPKDRQNMTTSKSSVCRRYLR